MERLTWDNYFMSLAKIASLRSNCKKRKVGCVIVKNKRVQATGMNGTPSGIKNCFEGGCPRCNDPNIHRGKDLDNCVCIHAEENALLEISRNNLIGSELYCTCFPCLGCAKKIVQCGIVKIFYMEQYNCNEITINLLNEAKIQFEIISAFSL